MNLEENKSTIFVTLIRFTVSFCWWSVGSAPAPAGRRGIDDGGGGGAVLLVLLVRRDDDVDDVDDDRWHRLDRLDRDRDRERR